LAEVAEPIVDRLGPSTHTPLALRNLQSGWLPDGIFAPRQIDLNARGRSSLATTNYVAQGCGRVVVSG